MGPKKSKLSMKKGSRDSFNRRRGEERRPAGLHDPGPDFFPAEAEEAAPAPEVLQVPVPAEAEEAAPAPEVPQVPVPAEAEEAAPAPEVLQVPVPAEAEEAAPAPEVPQVPVPAEAPDAEAVPAPEVPVAAEAPEPVPAMIPVPALAQDAEVVGGLGAEVLKMDRECQAGSSCILRTADASVSAQPVTRSVHVQTLKKVVHIRSREVQVSLPLDNIQPNTRTTVYTQTSSEDYLVAPDNFVMELCLSLKDVLNPAWAVSVENNTLNLAILGNSSVLLKSIILINNQIQLFVLGQPLKNSHPLWDITHEFSIGMDMSFTIALDVLKKLAVKMEAMEVCEGCRKCDEVWSQNIFSQRGFVDRFRFDTPVYRSNGCHLLLETAQSCLACRSEQTNMTREVNRRKKRAMTDRDTSKINIKYLPRHELINALSGLRENTKKFKREIKFMKSKIEKLLDSQAEDVSSHWSDHFKNINKKNFDRMSPLQQLFWEQQLKRTSMKNKASMKWHPMMIRLALHLEMTSPSATEILRKTGIISLPGKRTLFDYSHFIEAQEGCQQEILDDIREQLEKNTNEEHEKFVNLMFDGMHVRSNLVFSKRTGELVGYAKLTELEQEFENLQAAWSGVEARQPPLAKEVLVFMVRNISVNVREKVVKSIVAVFSVPPNIKADGIHSRLWEVMHCLEGSGIPVLSVICDGATQNRACLNLHAKWIPSQEDDWYDHMAPDDDNVHTTVNLASPDLRPLFFIIDPPHWLKTLRNAFGNSYCHKKSRRLWNKEDITWQLIVKYYEDHKNDKFRKSMINRQHVYLTSFSVMNVSLAAKVMSKTLSNAIEDSAKEASEKGLPYPPHKAAVEFMKKTNDVFDCLNGHNITSGKRFRNPNLSPYTSATDSRFDLMREYVNYLEEWGDQVSAREGNFSKNQRKAMMLPRQTTSAIATTVASFTGAVRYLLKAGAKEICARRFCQDPLEQIFSIFRRRGGSSNNPDVQQVLQSRVSIHAQRQVALPSSKGNTACDQEELEIDATPVPKRRKKSD